MVPLGIILSPLWCTPTGPLRYSDNMHTRHASLSALRRGEGALSACMRRCGETEAAAAFGAGLPGPRRNARMLRPASGSGPEQEPRPKARIPARATRRGRRGRSALRLRRRRGVAHLRRSLAVERLGGEAALARRGRRGGADGYSQGPSLRNQLTEIKSYFWPQFPWQIQKLS